MESDTIRRLLETSARYLELDILACAAIARDEALPGSADDEAGDEAASARVPLACLLSASG